MTGFEPIECRFTLKLVRDIITTYITPTDWSKLTDVVKIDVVKKTEYDELVKKINAIQAGNGNSLVKETAYNTKIIEIEKKITDCVYAKCIATQEFNNLTANIATRYDIAALVKAHTLMIN